MAANKRRRAPRRRAPRTLLVRTTVLQQANITAWISQSGQETAHGFIKHLSNAKEWEHQQQRVVGSLEGYQRIIQEVQDSEEPFDAASRNKKTLERYHDYLRDFVHFSVVIVLEPNASSRDKQIQEITHIDKEYDRMRLLSGVKRIHSCIEKLRERGFDLSRATEIFFLGKQGEIFSGSATDVFKVR